MALTALAAEAVGPALGVDYAEDGLPTRCAVARLIRSVLEARGNSRRADLERWCATLSAPHMHGSPALGERISAIVEIMLRAGEIGAHHRPEGSVVWCRDQHCVRLAPDRTVVLGAGPLAGDEKSQSGNGVLRFVEAHAAAVGLAVCLGAPDFMALPDGEPNAGVASLMAFMQRLADGDTTDVPRDAKELHWSRNRKGQRLGLLRQGEAYFLSVEAEGERRTVRLPDNETAGWLSLAVQFPGPVLSDTGPGFPAQVRAALALGCEPADDSLAGWSVPGWFEASFAQWLGEPMPETLEEAAGRDATRDRLASEPPGRRFAVEAGPGSGKTFTACARIASLIDAGVPPTRIWVISFTNAAVAELRSRIAAFLEDPTEARDISIMTLDSLAARFRRYGDQSGAGDLQSFEDGIQATTDLLRSGDRQLKGFVSTFEHMIVDEVQDLTSDRNELVLELIRTLPASCGVTLFLDSAQAIYGFARPSGAAAYPLLATRVLGDPALRFEPASLTGDHRTRSEKFRLVKEDMRRRLLASETDGKSLYTEVRNLLEEFASHSGRRPEDLIASHSAMILFRSHAELVRAATTYWDQGHNFRFRMSGGRPVLKSWIACCLAGLRSDAVLTPAEFGELWEALWPRPVEYDDWQEAWKALQTIAADGPADRVQVDRVAERLASAAPPGLAVDVVLGAGGALLSTIHGVKGREAEHVMMMLPKFRELWDGPDWGEEARVLFVGATRARRSLSIVSSRRYATRSCEGRSWSTWREVHARIEIGRDADVDDVLSVNGLPESLPGRAEQRQRTLRELARQVTKAIAVMSGGRYELFTQSPDGAERSIGFLSDDLARSLRRIGRELHPGGVMLPSAIRGLYCVDVRTVIIPEDASGDIRSRFGLSPVIIGFPPVFFKPGRPGQPAAASSKA